MSETKTLSGEPGSLSTLLRAALPVVPGVNQLPGVRKGPASAFTGLAYDRTGVVAERARVDAYAAVCGFPRKDVVPLTYPHMLAFPLHMAIMSDPAFPYPAIGMVHVENAITAHRAIGVGEALDVMTSVGAPRPHAKGVLLDFVTTVSANDETAWESTSTYLRRGRPVDGDPMPGLAIPDAPTGGVEWRLPADLGRTYASVSGDANPIHLYPLDRQGARLPAPDRARDVDEGALGRRDREPAARGRHRRGGLQEAGVPARHGRLCGPPGRVRLDLRAHQPEGRLAPPRGPYDLPLMCR